MCALRCRHRRVENRVEIDGLTANLDRHQCLVGKLHLAIGHGARALLNLNLIAEGRILDGIRCRKMEANENNDADNNTAMNK